MFGPLAWFGGVNVATWTFAVVLAALIALLLTALSQRAARRRSHDFGFVAGSLQARRFVYEHGHKLPPHRAAMMHGRAATRPHSGSAAAHSGADVPPPPPSAPSIGPGQPPP
ncbi:hypothetical protein, partial [Sediminivirga luteola]|uniref:hypothetical protein n=1 Tax=Sediminivirga luteola TaxID=1774748 RepID=UPI001F566AA9